jgi:putative transposase
LTEKNHREPWIADSIRERFHSYVVGVPLSRTRTISKLIEQTKTSTSSWLKMVDGISSHFSWQGGYAAFSVSESQVPVVKKYIQQQREHHGGNRRLSFQDELRALLKKSGVAFDERYLWD